MTHSERQLFAANLMNKCQDLLTKKGLEYATEDGDPNGNFKRVAAEQGEPVLKIWNTFFQKHLDSIRNYIKNPQHPLTEPIEGRIMDMINYLIILAALIEEGK